MDIPLNKIADEDKDLFDLLRNISTLGIEIHNDGIEFHPMLVMADGSKSFSIEDIKEYDYVVLRNLNWGKLPTVLRALISDILWINKKDYMAAQIAANAYWELFKLRHRDNNECGSLDSIKRAVCISIQTNQTSLYEEMCDWVKNYIGSDDAYQTGFFTLSLIELFTKQKNIDVSIFIPVLDKIIKRDFSNFSKIERAYELKVTCLFVFFDRRSTHIIYC